MSCLTVTNCKNCGAQLDLSAASNGVIRCSYCRSTFTLPKKEASPAAIQFLRIAEHDLDICNFDAAYEGYKKAAELDAAESEAFFGMALAEFRVQYIKDTVNNRLQPVCHGVTDKLFTENKNYQTALSLATAAQRVQYERQGEDIDYIRSEFYKLKNSGTEYDCFICVKVTDDETKTRTSDYKDADDIYFELKGKGYKPFFSERELKNVSGADYEARILYALYSSECMLVVCNKESYLQTPWVKNEYTRFLKLIGDEEKESDSITIVYSGTPIERLPGKNGKIQGIDITRLNSFERIETFVESHTPAGKARRKHAASAKTAETDELKRKLEEQTRILKSIQSPAASSSGVSAESLMLRARQEWDNLNTAKATEYLNRVLDIAPAYAEAWWLLMLVELKSKDEETLFKNFDEWTFGKIKHSLNFKNAQKYADADFKEKIDKFLAKSEKLHNQISTAESLKRQFPTENGVLIQYCGFDENVAVPEGITEIGSYVFSHTGDWNIKNHLGNKIVKSVTLPKSLKIIGSRAFVSNYDIKNIIIPNGVVKISDSSFSLCANLIEINIPGSVETIGEHAFFCCGNLERITLNKGLKIIDKYAFDGCEVITDIHIPDTVTKIGESAFCGCIRLKKITIPDSVKTIGESAFDRCRDLTEVTIPRRFEKQLRKIFGKDKIGLFGPKIKVNFT